VSINSNFNLNTKSYTQAHREFIRNSRQQKPASYIKYENPTFYEENKDLLWILGTVAGIIGGYAALKGGYHKFLNRKPFTRQITPPISEELAHPFRNHPWITEVLNEEIKKNPEAYHVIVLKNGTLEKNASKIKRMEEMNHLINEKKTDFYHRKIHQYGKANGKEFIIVNSYEGKDVRLKEMPGIKQLNSLMGALYDMEAKNLFVKGIELRDFSFCGEHAVLKGTHKIYQSEEAPVNFIQRTGLPSVTKNFYWDIMNYFRHIKNYYLTGKGKNGKITVAENFERQPKIREDKAKIIDAKMNEYDTNFRSAYQKYFEMRAKDTADYFPEVSKIYSLQAQLLKNNNPEFLKMQEMFDRAITKLEQGALTWYEKGEANVGLDNGLRTVNSYFDAIELFTDLREATVKYYNKQDGTPLPEYANYMLAASDAWIKRLTDWLFKPAQNSNEGILPKIHELIGMKTPASNWDIARLQLKVAHDVRIEDVNKEGAVNWIKSRFNKEADNFRAVVYGNIDDGYQNRLRRASNEYLDSLYDMINKLDNGHDPMPRAKVVPYTIVEEALKAIERRAAIATEIERKQDEAKKAAEEAAQKGKEAIKKAQEEAQEVKAKQGAQEIAHETSKAVSETPETIQEEITQEVKEAAQQTTQKRKKSPKNKE